MARGAHLAGQKKNPKNTEKSWKFKWMKLLILQIFKDFFDQFF